MAKLQEQVDRLMYLFSVFKAEIETKNRQGLFDINKYSEDLLIPVLDCTYGHHFRNAEYEKKNKTAIDLIDEKARVCVQVTSENDGDKIKKTITKYRDAEYYKQFDTLFFYFLTGTPTLRNDGIQTIQNLAGAEIDFNVDKHLLDNDKVLKILRRDPSGEKIDCVLSWMEKQYGEGPRSKEEIADSLRKGSQKLYSSLTETGRFRYLHIVDQLLPSISSPHFETIVETPDLGNQVMPLTQSIEALQHQSVHHAVIVGEGGLGKTVSLLTLWKKYLESDNPTIPIYIALNEYNPEDPDNFITQYIARYYLEQQNLTQEEENQLWKIFIHPAGHDSDNEVPSVLFLLDGFNEVKSEQAKLLRELKGLVNRAKEVQILINSRYDMRHTFDWSSFHLLNLTYLQQEQIKNYLDAYADVSYPESPVLRQLITIPLNLTLYAATSGIISQHQNNPFFNFKREVSSAGELLFNYFEAQLVKEIEEGVGTKKATYDRFVLQHVLAFIGHEMELSDSFEVSEQELNELIREYHEQFNDANFVDVFFATFSAYEVIAGSFRLHDLSGFEAIREVKGIKDLLQEKYNLLVKEGDTYRLLHQNFRDFLAALHVRNDIFLSESQESIPSTLKSVPLSASLRKYLGEISGEHYNVPQAKLKESGYKSITFKPSPLSLLLDRLRGIFNREKLGYVVWNIVMIWYDTRGDLSGADLSSLHLVGFVFNRKHLYRKYGDNYFGAKFNHSLLDEKDFLMQGHQDRIYILLYSPNGSRILSAENNLIIERSVRTGEHNFTLEVPQANITCVSYSHDGSRILMGLHNGALFEFSSTEEKYRRPLLGHKKAVTSVQYSPDGSKVLSGSLDGSVKVWSSDTGEVIKDFTTWQKAVHSVCYGPDEKTVFSGMGDGTVKQWSVDESKCVKIFKTDRAGARIDKIICPPEDSKIVFRSSGGMIREWSIDEECPTLTVNAFDVHHNQNDTKFLSYVEEGVVKETSIKNDERLLSLSRDTSQGDNLEITSICYSPDGSKILSAYKNIFVGAKGDRDIAEWSVSTGEILQTFNSHSNWVNSIYYSEDGTRAIFSTFDGTIIEWDLEKNRCVQVLTGHTDLVTGINHHPTNKDRILSGSGDGTVREWSLETGECLDILQKHKLPINDVCYSSNGLKMFSCSRDGKLFMFERKDNEIKKTELEGHTAEATSLFSVPSQEIIITSSVDETIKFWSAINGENIKTIHTHVQANYVETNKDGSKVLTSDRQGNAKEWSVNTGEILFEIKNEKGWINKACYSPDKSKILMCGWSGAVKEWSIDEKRFSKEIQATEKSGIFYGANTVCYSPDGSKFLSCGQDGKVREWSSDSGECLNTIAYEPGLWIQGCSFRQLHPDSKFSDDDEVVFRNYGAVLG